MSEPSGAGPLAVLQDRARALSFRVAQWRVRMRSGEIVFYVVAVLLALTIALQPRSLIAAALFVAVTAIALVVALEG